MQRRAYGTEDKVARGSWFSTARLTGRFFAAERDEARLAGKTIKEGFDESFEGTHFADDQGERDAFVSLPAASRMVARKISTIQKSDHANRDRVILFAPGPITEGDLLRENRVHHVTIRRHRRRYKRFRWLMDNAGTVAFVIGLLILVWFVSAR